MSLIFKESAPRYWAAGLQAIPLIKHEKRPAISAWQNWGQVKIPEDQKSLWLELYADGNIGLPAGPGSNICFIDIDAVEQNLIDLIESCLPKSPWRRVGKKGCVLAFKYNGAKSFKIKTGPDQKPIVEFFSTSGQVVLPPSIHPETGLAYTSEANLWEVVGQLPEISPDIEKQLVSALQLDVSKRRQLTFEEGTRNADLFSHAIGLWHRGYDERHIEASCLGINAELTNPLSEQEVRTTVQSAVSYDRGVILALTERELSEKFAGEVAGKLTSVEEGGFAYYAKGRWHEDPRGLACQEAVKTLMTKLEQDARSRAREMDREDGDRLIALAKRFQTATAIAHVAKLAASDPQLLCPLSKFDALPELLNLKNGTYDLEKGKLLEFDPRHYLMHQANVEYQPDAECPLFDKFLSEILDDETGDFLLQALAYSLLAAPDRQIMFLLLGRGNNGKTTLINVMRKVLGDYSITVEPDSLVKRDGGSIRNDIARMRGARAIFTSEFARGARIDAPLIKRLTGSEQMTARFLNQEFFEFDPTGVFFLTTNHLPIIDGGDFALRRRMVVVPFDYEVPPDKIDPSLEGELIKESSGIFNRLLKALSAYRKDRLRTFPSRVKAATDKYLEDSDLIGGFIRDCCEVSEDQKVRVGAMPLHVAYVSYCQGLGVKAMSMPQLKQTLEKQKGFIQKRISGNFVWIGLKLRPAERPADSMASASIYRAMEEAQACALN